jgi:hypothetical protein
MKRGIRQNKMRTLIVRITNYINFQSSAQMLLIRGNFRNCDYHENATHSVNVAVIRRFKDNGLKPS